ncbi:MAG TPA: hypothetical protein VMB52_01695 [Verrucomicrobiae bacterium]|nr:hypothetical protein [Verrucomicrobiae bacterium]
MHVIEPTIYQPVREPRRRWVYVIAPFILIVVLAVINYLRPMPTATVFWNLQPPATDATPTLSWPTEGQAAVAAEGYGPLDTFGSQTPTATASIAKVILALCVLQKQPLNLGQTGQIYTVDADDVATYQAYAAQDGSTLQVTEGEQLTEYQALQALMLPSANNIADSLSRWVFGNQADYVTYSSAWLQRNGLDNTHIGIDASGFDPSTTSTASDLAQLGLLAAHNPVLMSIAGQSTATLPVAGVVSNYDTVLGQSGIDGLKTGNNASDLGAFLFTATTAIGGKTLRLTGAIMGAPDLNTALQESVQLAASAETGFEQTTIAQAGKVVGSLRTAWGSVAPILVAQPVQLVRWKGTPITERHQVDASTRSGVVGQLNASAGPNNTETALRLGHSLASPTLWWRLTRH